MWNPWGRLRKFLWPSQKSWTLKKWTAEHAKIPPQPKCFSYGRSIFLSQIRSRPDFFDFCFQWASIVHGFRVTHPIKNKSSRVLSYKRTIFKYNLVHTLDEKWKKRNYVLCRDSLTFNLTRDYFIIPNGLLLIKFGPQSTLCSIWKSAVIYIEFDEHSFSKTLKYKVPG